MAIFDDMADLEARLKAANISVSMMCVKADIARSTWDRWRRGETEPNFRSWRAVQKAASALLSDRPAIPAAPSEDAA